MVAEKFDSSKCLKAILMIQISLRSTLKWPKDWQKNSAKHKTRQEPSMIHSASPQSGQAVKICFVVVDFDRWGRTNGQRVKIVITPGQDCARPCGSIYLLMIWNKSWKISYMGVFDGTNIFKMCFKIWNKISVNISLPFHHHCQWSSRRNLAGRF